MTISENGSQPPFYTLTNDELTSGIASQSGSQTSVSSYSPDDIHTYLQQQAVMQILQHEEQALSVTPNQDDIKLATQELQSSSQSQASQSDIETQAKQDALLRVLAEGAYQSNAVDREKLAQTYYQQNLTTFTHGNQICVHVMQFAAGSASSATPTDADFADALAKANDAEQQLKTKDFATVADAAAPNAQAPGGDFGCQDEAQLLSSLPADVKAAIQGEAAGGTTAPLKLVGSSGGGYVIVKVDSRKEAHTDTFDEAKATVYQQVDQNVGKQLLVQKVTQYVVDINPRFGYWNPTSFQVAGPDGAAVVSTTSTTAPRKVPSLTPPGTQTPGSVPPATAAPTGTDVPADAGTTPPATAVPGTEPAAVTTTTR
jgi:hypothetical protein